MIRLVIVLLAALPTVALAQWGPPPMNQVTLTASAVTEVPSDTVTAVLYTEEQGPDPADLANHVTAALQDAFAKVKGDRRIDAKSGGYQTYPVYGQQGQVTGWRMRADIVLESKDFGAMGARVTELQRTLKLAQMTFSLSPGAREKAESDLTTQALARFRARASGVASALGFPGYQLGQLTIQNEGGVMPGPYRANAIVAQRAEVAAPVPVEAGRTPLTITVSGSIVLGPAPAH